MLGLIKLSLLDEAFFASYTTFPTDSSVETCGSIPYVSVFKGG